MFVNSRTPDIGKACPHAAAARLKCCKIYRVKFMESLLDILLQALYFNNVKYTFHQEDLF